MLLIALTSRILLNFMFCIELYINVWFSLQTNHLRKFLEFRVLMGIVDNVVAKCELHFCHKINNFDRPRNIPLKPFVYHYRYRHSRRILRRQSSVPRSISWIHRPVQRRTFQSQLNRTWFRVEHIHTPENKRCCFSFQFYYTMGRMLVKLAEAIGRLVLAGREMTRLAGFTARVTEIMNVLQDLNKGHYVRSMLQEEKTLAIENGKLLRADWWRLSVSLLGSDDNR